jgi:hypothetical protein
LIFGKFVLGILVGFFVVPAMLIDPQGTISTFQNIAGNIAGKLAEFVGYVGGIAS